MWELFFNNWPGGGKYLTPKMITLSYQNLKWRPHPSLKIMLDARRIEILRFMADMAQGVEKLKLS